MLGSDPSRTPSYAQVNQLTYVSQILKETLRLWPTAPAFALAPHKDTVIGGQYTMKKSYQIVVLVGALHRDPAVWGDNAEVFDPDNFSREAERARPANAYKPFGNGQRACIGRQFALQEATLVLGMILQRFKLIDHTRYQLKIKERSRSSPTASRSRSSAGRPADRSDVARRRRGDRDRRRGARRGGGPERAAATAPRCSCCTGRTSGTAEGLARQIAEDGLAQGFAATVAPLDDYAGRLPTRGRGHDRHRLVQRHAARQRRADSATGCARARSSPERSRACSYAVFGCGNRDWASTFQADSARSSTTSSAAHGARRMHAARRGRRARRLRWAVPGLVQAAVDHGRRRARHRPRAGAGRRRKEPLYTVEIVPGQRMSPFVDSLGARPMAVTVNRELHAERRRRALRAIDAPRRARAARRA